VNVGLENIALKIEAAFDKFLVAFEDAMFGPKPDNGIVACKP